MLLVSYAGKNAYSAGKTSGLLRGANRCYVLAHCASLLPPQPTTTTQKLYSTLGQTLNLPDFRIIFYIFAKNVVAGKHLPYVQVKCLLRYCLFVDFWNFWRHRQRHKQIS